MTKLDASNLPECNDDIRIKNDDNCSRANDDERNNNDENDNKPTCNSIVGRLERIEVKDSNQWCRDIEDRIQELLRDDSPPDLSLVNSFSGLDSSSELDSLNSYYVPPKDQLNLACTNARSIVEKIGSLVTLFDECGLHFTILTETWLSKKHCPPRVMSDLTHGANLNFIRKDRNTRGGGVAAVIIQLKYG